MMALAKWSKKWSGLPESPKATESISMLFSFCTHRSTGKLSLSSSPSPGHWWLLRRQNSGVMEEQTGKELLCSGSKLVVTGVWAHTEQKADLYRTQITPNWF